jgi:hypothetical protein
MSGAVSSTPKARERTSAIRVIVIRSPASSSSTPSKRAGSAKAAAAAAPISATAMRASSVPGLTLVTNPPRTPRGNMNDGDTKFSMKAAGLSNVQCAKPASRTWSWIAVFVSK